jgi:dolichol-phosphate mannosyltransferase
MSNAYTLSLIIPCYNEEDTIERCVEQTRKINDGQDFAIELIVVDDNSTDKSAEKLFEISKKYPELKVFTHEKNRGKGAALRTGFAAATGDYIGIQDADDEYNPMDYLELLKPLLENKADVVYGSRYRKHDTSRVQYFWHTWMNKALTFVSNMFTNLDITDTHTCYKLFKREVIAEIAPTLEEERFGFCPEITCKVAQGGYRLYETAISYNPRNYEAGKKIGWKDGIRALYCLFHYGAHTSPLPMQIILYIFIGAVSLIANVTCFGILNYVGFSLSISIISALIFAAAVNYILCIMILFRHNSMWNNAGEFLFYLLTITVMGGLDYVLTHYLITLLGGALVSKIIAAFAGVAGNFALRRWLVFPERKKR